MSFASPARFGAVAAAAIAVLFVAAGAAQPPTQAVTRSDVYAHAQAAARLGRMMFSDVSLSASGVMSCASCHDPAHGFAPDNAFPVQLGGAHMDQPGLRNVPALTYIQSSPAFTEHLFDNEDEGDESVDNGPSGGLTWDGRVDRGSAQAKIPLLSPFEMANATAADVVKAVSRASYANDFAALYGADVFNDTDKAFDDIAAAFEAYEEDYSTFYPYSSKYDAYLKGQAQLTAEEKHGLDLFEAEDKGNCSSCHLSEPANDGTPPQFTDFGLLALAVPRNAAIPANQDPAYYDLGACGPQRTDLRNHPEYCGIFLTPSLRNVALRQSFFHNGEFHDLRKVVDFYATRDTDPGKWYPRNADGTIRQYDDLPKQYWGNINMDPPFGGKPGDKPQLTDAEIDDIVAFLKTLTDGYTAPQG